MKILRLLFAAIFVFLVPAFIATAQLVKDGATATINGTVTNISGTLTVGTNGSFTTLTFSNGGKCTNSGNGIIGLNSTARTNHVIVTGAGSVWNSGGNLELGSQGSFNLLVVSNGGMVLDGFGNISFNAGSAANSALITGPNSIWTNSQNVNIGNSGPFNVVTVTNGGLLGVADLINVGNGSSSNQLIVADGGAVVCGTGGRIGGSTFSSENVAVVTGPGSYWSSSSEIDVGYDGTANQLWVTNGGKIYSEGAFVGADAIQDGSGVGSLAVLSGTGVAWTNYANFGLGNIGSSNQMSILNGAVLDCEGGAVPLYVATQPGSSNNVLLISGANSLFSSPAGFFYLGLSGSFNRLLVTNGGTLATADGYVGGNGGSSNNLALVTDAGSAWNLPGSLCVGNSGPENQLTVTNGATVSVQAGLYVGFNASSTNNLVLMEGGALLATNGGSGVIDVRRGTFAMNGGVLVTDRLLLTNGARSVFTLDGGTVETGGTVQGGSVFQIAGGNVTAELLLTGTGTHVFTNGLRIGQKGLLEGGGTITANVTNLSAGTLSPGDGLGRLTINGYLSMASGSSNIFEVNAATKSSDRISGLTGVTYGGMLIVSNLSGTLAAGDAYKLFTAAVYRGAFSSLIPNKPGPGLRWSTNGLPVDGTLRVAASPATPPAITNTAFSDPTHLAISVTGGVPYEPVYLRTATTITLPLTSWAYVATNTFDASGNAVFSASFSAAEAKRFYVLQVQ